MRIPFSPPAELEVPGAQDWEIEPEEAPIPLVRRISRPRPSTLAGVNGPVTRPVELPSELTDW